MTKAVIGALRVNLGLDSAAFSKGIKESQNRMSGFGKNLAKIGAGISVVSAGVTYAMRRQINDADNMSKSAQKFGVPIESLSGLRHAADMSGVSFEALGTGLVKMSSLMGDAAAGNKLAMATFEQLGVSVTDTNGQLRPTEAVLGDVADALANMNDGAEKTDLTAAIFGRGNTGFIPLLNGGSAGLRQMTQEARDLGLVISAETGKSSENFNDNLSRLQKTLGGMTTQIAGAMVPALERLSNFVVSASEAFRGLSPQTQTTIAVIAGVTAVVGPLLAGLGLAVTGAAAVGTAFSAMGAVLLANPIGLVVAAVAGAGLLIYQNWEPIKAFFVDLWETISTSATAAWEKIKAIVGGWVTSFTEIGANMVEGMRAGLAEKWQGMVDWFEGKVTGLTSSVKGWLGIESPSRVFREIGAYVTEGMAKGLSDNIPMVSAAMSGVQGAVDGQTGSLSSGMNEFGNAAKSAFVGFLSGAKSAKAAAADFLSSISQKLIGSAFDGLLGGFFSGGGSGGFLGSLFGFANGTNFAPGGLSMVGERGPELVNLPRGSQVIDAQRTKGMLDRAGRQDATAAAQVMTKIVNVLDPAIVGDYLSTAPGERLILNVVQRNQGALRLG
jgi:hypothetical protein